MTVGGQPPHIELLLNSPPHFAAGKENSCTLATLVQTMKKASGVKLEVRRKRVVAKLPNRLMNTGAPQ